MTEEVGGAASLTFEAALARLEEIVGKLERGEARLEESMALFEEGVGLSRRCQALLDDADARIQRLVAESGGRFTLESMRVEEGEDTA